MAEHKFPSKDDIADYLKRQTHADYLRAKQSLGESEDSNEEPNAILEKVMIFSSSNSKVVQLARPAVPALFTLTMHAFLCGFNIKRDPLLSIVFPGLMVLLTSFVRKIPTGERFGVLMYPKEAKAANAYRFWLLGKFVKLGVFIAILLGFVMTLTVDVHSVTGMCKGGLKTAAELKIDSSSYRLPPLLEILGLRVPCIVQSVIYGLVWIPFIVFIACLIGYIGSSVYTHEVNAEALAEEMCDSLGALPPKIPDDDSSKVLPLVTEGIPATNVVDVAKYVDRSHELIHKHRQIKSVLAKGCTDLNKLISVLLAAAEGAMLFLFFEYLDREEMGSIMGFILVGLINVLVLLIISGITSRHDAIVKVMTSGMIEIPKGGEDAFHSLYLQIEKGKAYFHVNGMPITLTLAIRFVYLLGLAFVEVLRKVRPEDASPE